MTNRSALFLLPLFLFALAPGEAAAKVLSTHADWTAIEEREGANKVCFVATAPAKSEGKYTKRGDVFLLVTHRPAEKATGVVSIQTGYTYKARSDAAARIGTQTFRLFTDGENAWARDDATDRALIQAMRKGANMVVTGTSSRGTRTTDTYSLSGFSAAYRAASKACGVK